MEEIVAELKKLNANVVELMKPNPAIAEFRTLLEDLVAEQRKTGLFTLTLERDRLLSALMEAGLGIPILTANEFSLVAGATTTIIQLVIPGYVHILAGPAIWYTSLPWWCSYSVWMDTTAPATPFATATRMPESLQTPDFRGIMPMRAFGLHQVTNNHATQHAYCMVQNMVIAVTVETWSLIKAVYLDPIVADVREKAAEFSGILR